MGAVTSDPFAHTVPEQERDERLRKRLQDDPRIRSAILAWAVKGGLLRRGEKVCGCHRRAGAMVEYHSDNDPISDFLAECFEDDPDGWTPTTEIRRLFAEWAKQHGEHPLNSMQIARAMQANGYGSAKRHGQRGRIGLVPKSRYARRER